MIRHFGPALVSGLLLATCFPRFHAFFLAWVALVPLLWRARGLSPRGAALHFFVAGFMFHVVLLQWLLSNIMWAGGWAVIGQQILCAILALYWAAMGYAWRWLHSRNPLLGAPLSFAVLWTTMEYLQATLFTGFGWSSLAYSQGRDLALLQWAALGTGLAISFLIALGNALVAEAIGSRARALGYLAGAAIVAAGAHGIGYALIEPASRAEDPLRVGLFQSNYSLEMKWDPEYRYETIRNAAEKSVALAEGRDLDLMVWPEALILAEIGNPEIAELISRTTREGGFQLLAGAGRLEGGKDYNSALLFDEAGRVEATYDKIHLAPFGEYVPLSKYLPFVTKFVPTIGDLASGTEPVLMPVDGRKIGPLICFEVLFAPMAGRLRRDGADALVVATNLAWFGRSTAIPQELEIARVRAVETRLPLIHAANTGIAGVFDPYGRFEAVDLYAARGPRLYPLPEDTPLDALVMQRLAGRFELPGAAPQPWLGVHRAVPWVLLGACALLLALALLAPAKARRD